MVGDSKGEGMNKVILYRGDGYLGIQGYPQQDYRYGSNTRIGFLYVIVYQ